MPGSDSSRRPERATSGGAHGAATFGSIIGLIIPTANHPCFGQLTGSIEARAYEAGYKLLLAGEPVAMENVLPVSLVVGESA